MDRSASIAAAVCLLIGARGAAVRGGPPALRPFDRPAMESHALMDMSFVLAGVRRFGADMAFIQMLQYYATRETPAGHEEPHDHDHDHVSEGRADLHPETQLAEFPLLRDYILRVVALDPLFHYAYLFGAGALAFNLNRVDEALDLLDRGSRADPSFWQFRLYAGAIGFRRTDQVDKVMKLLEEAIQYPDCPSMLQNILANIYRKVGNNRRAAEIYIRMIETSRDSNYVELARRKLQDMGFRI